MSSLIRQILLAILITSLFSCLILAATFSVFPLVRWSDLWQSRIYNVPYIYFILMLTVVTGTMIGALSRLVSRKKVIAISQSLENLIKGRKLKLEENEGSSDLGSIQKKLNEIEEKMTKQAEVAQKLATERANDREKSLQEVVVQERNRLARELHDSVSQQLFAASMMMATINETNPPSDEGMKKQLTMVEKMIDQSQLEMRALLLHLRPAALKDKSLKEGIEDLLAELTEKVSLKIEVKLEELSVDKGVEDHLFRILQESVSNTLRHAKAAKLNVILIERDQTVILRISDDGKGFNVQEVQNHGSYGLQNMHERAVEVGGVLKVVSVENEGTKLEVKVPTLKKDGETDD
ncbi:sensor histidine kinase [Salipaludibacillus agaradhaerens]|uniref:sensor histidine kinase n=1 Tax=Salipaludibacillus agaradhaerens TaxID=76935 RepID=UPI0009968552|nr:sensor histidine kinase [Salipaludibacillus agaradhaerens]